MSRLIVCPRCRVRHDPSTTRHRCHDQQDTLIDAASNIALGFAVATMLSNNSDPSGTDSGGSTSSSGWGGSGGGFGGGGSSGDW